MPKELRWIDEKTFTIGTERITLDYQEGGSGRRSGTTDFTMMKSPSFLDHYLALEGQNFKKILELGVYQGGSFVFLDQLLEPDRISAVELTKTPIPALDRYIADRRERAKVYYGTSQADTAALEEIVAADFGGEVDLVVDDASHWYEFTKISFQTLFPRLRPGGLYIIEDWMWSFSEDAQRTSHPWSEQPSLANLLLDLSEEMAKVSVETVVMDRDLLLIRKSGYPTTQPVFEGGRFRRRERLLV